VRDLQEMGRKRVCPGGNRTSPLGHRCQIAGDSVVVGGRRGVGDGFVASLSLNLSLDLA
jgi:hypothetical protein